ncbi:MAG: hypothetical protein OXG09_04335 [Chloroflexi bacterium]|nr:hypothetical protein [Chloroflexota bacterium]
MQSKANTRRATPAMYRVRNDQWHLILNEDEPWPSILAEIEKQLDRPIEVQNRQDLIVELGARQVPKYELVALMNLLHQHGIQVSALNSSHPITSASAASFSLKHTAALGVGSPVSDRIFTYPGAQLPLLADDQGLPAQYLPHDIQSGKRVYSRGPLIINGNVCRGAAVMSEGDILIWGKLLGSAHAGLSNNRGAVIRAFALDPEHVSIGDQPLSQELIGSELGPSEIRWLDHALEVVPLTIATSSRT